MPLTAVSLFSGAGGLDVGVEDAGFEVRCCVEINAYAAETLRLNKWLSTASEKEFDVWFRTTGGKAYTAWPPEAVDRVRRRVSAGVGRHAHLRNASVIEADIRTVTSQAVEEAAGVTRGALDLLFGGPPCQSFSRAGKRAGVDDERGQLFLEFVRLANDLRPRLILLENVKGLVQTKANSWRAECSQCGWREVPPFDPDVDVPEHGSSAGPCPKCAAETKWKVESNKPGGSLDWIQSAFERIGYRTEAFLINAVDFGVPQRRERVFVVGTRDDEALFAPSPSSDKPTTAWDTLFATPNPDHIWPLDPNRAVLWVKNVVRPHDEPVTWDLRLPAPTIGAHQGAKLAIAPFGVPEEQLLRQQWHLKGKRQGDTPPVPVEHSYLSDRDLLMLQTFPSHWFVAGTRMERAFQIGNAVPPRLGAQVAGALARAAGVSLGARSEVSYRRVSPVSDTAQTQLGLFA
jgi:DNA (cytosine-5)-methyltransferase 1